MAQLPPDKIARKVLNPLIVNLATTLIVGLVTKSPLGDSEWVSWLQDPAVSAALITIIALGVGYQTEETTL